MKHGEPVVCGTEAIGDLPGAIVGAVVDEDDFEVVVMEGEERSEGTFDGMFLVLGGDDDGEARERGIVCARWCDFVELGDLDGGADGKGRDSDP